jgi:hypothetical protein
MTEAYKDLEKSARMLRETAEQVRRSRQHIYGFTHGSDALRADELERQAKVMEDHASKARQQYVNWLWGH